MIEKEGKKRNGRKEEMPRCKTDERERRKEEGENVERRKMEDRREEIERKKLRRKALKKTNEREGKEERGRRKRKEGKKIDKDDSHDSCSIPSSSAVKAVIKLGAKQRGGVRLLSQIDMNKQKRFLRTLRTG